MELDAEQHQAVHSDAPTLRVMAGAGSGKTRVLTQRVARRIADESVDPAHTLVLTFTRKAADELRERLSLLTEEEQPPVVTGTFHAIAYAQLRRRWLDQGRSAPTIASNPSRLVSAVLEKLRMDRIANPRFIAAELSWAKAHQLKPDTYAKGLDNYSHKSPVSVTQMERIFEAYEWEKKRRRVVDYDDLLLLLTDAMRTDRSFLVTQQWQFRHFFVDEFQDLNRAQFELLRAWLGPRDDLFVVGDSNQAIYGWNGADSSYLNDLDRYFPQIETIALRTNYRSSQSVLAAAHSLISDEVVTPESAHVGSPPNVRAFSDEEAEADGIARAVREAHHRNHRWSDIAVLVRTNTRRGPIERALAKYGVPFRSAGGAAWLYESEVKDALDYLRSAAGSLLSQRAPDIAEMIEESGAEPSPYMAQLQSAVQACLVTDPSMTVGDFLAWVEVGSKQDAPTYSGAVAVTTFHRAKGLEWPVVFVVGVEEGLVPIKSGEVKEEKRLILRCHHACP